MATRVYLMSVVPPVAPALNAGWNVTSGNVIRLMNTYTDRTSTGVLTSGQTGAAAVRKVILRQYITQPLIAQTLNGTFTGQVKMFMNSVSARTGEGWIYLRLVNPDGTIANEITTLTTTALVATTATNRTFIAYTFSSLSITAGQRIAIDFGWNYSTGVNTVTTGSASIFNNSASDLPVDNTSTSAFNPWFEFSQTLKFTSQTYGFF